MLFIADHASKVIPKLFIDYRLNKKILNSHIAYDLGVRELTINLSQRLNCEYILGKYSRLLIDLNRDINDPTLVPEIVDNKIININSKLTKNQFRNRLNIYNEYHLNISNYLTEKKINCLISLHSFNPIFKNKRRNIDIGILSNSDRRLSNKLIANLKKTNFKIGDNEPYVGNLIGDTMFKHGLKKNILHSLIEVRNDYLTTNSKFIKISDLLKKVITQSVKDL